MRRSGASQFEESDDVGRSLSADRPQAALLVVEDDTALHSDGRSRSLQDGGVAREDRLRRDLEQP
jgi:hypothetical protein